MTRKGAPCVDCMHHDYLIEIMRRSPVETVLQGTNMNTEHSHPIIHPATVDSSNPNAPKRTFAKSIVSNRLRQRISVALGLCVGLTVLLIAFE